MGGWQTLKKAQFMYLMSCHGCQPPVVERFWEDNINESTNDATSPFIK